MQTTESFPEVKIDIEELGEFHDSGKLIKDVCIFRVHHAIKQTNEEAYNPVVIGLGPYHHLEGNLPNLKYYKKEAVKRNLERMVESSTSSLSVQLDILRATVERLKPDIQKFYEEEFKFNPDIFILDCCFLIELCVPSSKRGNTNEDIFHQIFSGRRPYSALGFSIRLDCLKLENQIPLFLVREFLQMQSLEDQCLLFFVINVIPFVGDNVDQAAIKILEEKHAPRHILEWLHRCMVRFIRDAGTEKNQNDMEEHRTLQNAAENRNLQNIEQNNTAVKEGNEALFWKMTSKCNNIMCYWKRQKKDKKQKSWSLQSPRAEHLKRVGVSFKAGEPLSFQEKHFNFKGILRIPPFRVDDSSQVSLRNVIAYEECLAMENNVVSAFMGLMNCLIDKEDDVGFLKRARIIDNVLESDVAVAELINSLTVNITVNGIPQIDNINKKLREYHESSWRVMAKDFVDTHFSRPWYVIALIVAAIALGLTIVQTIYSIKGK